MDNGYARAALAGPAGTSGTVGVVLHIVGQPVVDDVGEVLHVKAARRHVGGYEQLRAVLAELLHGQVALRLRKVAVQGLGIVAVANQQVGHLLGFHARTAEDDAVDFGIIVHHPLEGEILVARLHQVIDMVDVLRAFVARAHHDFLVVMKIGQRNALYLLAHGG